MDNYTGERGQNVTKTNKNGTIRVRINYELKEAAEKILEDVGLSPSKAIELLYNQIIIQEKLPFEIRWILYREG